MAHKELKELMSLWQCLTFLDSADPLYKIISYIPLNGEPGSSVSIVSGYGLDYRTIEVRSPAEAKGFFSNLYVQTGSEAHPASSTMGIGWHFPGAKARPGRDADHSLQLVQSSRMSRSYTSSPSKRLRGV
jgi:hypothetical protein